LKKKKRVPADMPRRKEKGGTKRGVPVPYAYGLKNVPALKGGKLGGRRPSDDVLQVLLKNLLQGGKCVITGRTDDQ